MKVWCGLKFDVRIEVIAIFPFAMIFFSDFNIRSREWSRDIRSNRSFKVTFKRRIPLENGKLKKVWINL